MKQRLSHDVVLKILIEMVLIDDSLKVLIYKVTHKLKQEAITVEQFTDLLIKNT